MATSQLIRNKIRVIQHFPVTCLQEVKPTESSDLEVHTHKNKKGELLYVKEFAETHHRVLFSGSRVAYEIWAHGHQIPADVTVETHGARIGNHGRGGGRVLIHNVEGGGDSGKDGSALPFCPNACHSSRVGYP